MVAVAETGRRIGRWRWALWQPAMPVATIATAAALIGGACVSDLAELERYCTDIRELGAAVSREAIGIMHKLMTAVEGEARDSGRKSLNRPVTRRSRRRKRDRPVQSRSRRCSIRSPRASVVYRARLVALNQPRLWGGFQRGPLIVRKAAAIAMLSAPLLVAPAMANISSGQPRLDTAGSATIVINSTPTIVINACQPTDIEQQIMEALRRHREALYEQLCSELQRRQRTEF